MFTGREYDAETGLYYYRARFYNPHIGRFMQTDPIGYAGGLNLYTYCGNNSVNFVDPSGLGRVTIVGAYYGGLRITIGRNSGQWSGSIAFGPGMGASISYDHTNRGIRRRGFSRISVTDASIESGSFSAGLCLETSTTNNIYDAETTLQSTFGIGPVQGNATENKNTREINSGPGLGVGAGAFAGYGFSYTGQAPEEKGSNPGLGVGTGAFGDYGIAPPSQATEKKGSNS